MENKEDDDDEDELMCWECVTDENVVTITQDLHCKGVVSKDGLSSEGRELESESGVGVGMRVGVGLGSSLSHTPHERGVMTLFVMRRLRAWRVLFTPTCPGTNLTILQSIWAHPSY